MPGTLACRQEAARSKIPGKNPKTQREEQSGRLVSRRREDAPDRWVVNRISCEKHATFAFFQADLGGQPETIRGCALLPAQMVFFYWPVRVEAVVFAHGSLSAVIV